MFMGFNCVVDTCSSRARVRNSTATATVFLEFWSFLDMFDEIDG